MAMGAETSKFMGSICIRIIDRTCHWSASENENENKENVLLTLKEQAKQQQQQQKETKLTQHTLKQHSSCRLLKNGLIHGFFY